MSAKYPEYAQWLSQVRRSMKLPKAVELSFDQGRLYMSPVTEAHSEADDSIRLQLGEQLGGESGLHVTRDKGRERLYGHLAGCRTTAGRSE
ncbi:hypothetical protein ACQPZG_17370 [Streptomyces sp. CA-294286]|uniref:hypothetical protein n=1 Tax=Streptomyces sp. CA-294286 TaxID=3240070 RepID=UPI003D918E94